MTEKLIMKFILPRIQDLRMVDAIVTLGYRKTGNKFSVAFNGSKGYLSNIEISCEGYQKEENRIFIENLRNKNGTLKSKMVNVFFSDENGIRLSIGKDIPKVFQTEKQEEALSMGDDDLPF